MKVHDHGLIGDGRPSALVSRPGAIDWPSSTARRGSARLSTSIAAGAGSSAYGVRTPITAVLAHVAFGFVLGAVDTPR